MNIPALSQSKALEQHFTKALRAYTKAEARVIFKVLTQKFWHWPDSWFWQNQPIELTAQQQNAMEGWIGRLQKQEPYQYLVGEMPFAGMELRVSPAALIPRPETEELLSQLLSRTKNPRTALDIGTGTGCLALGIKKHWPMCSVRGWDVSEEALNLAAQNALNLQLEVQWQRVDALQLKAHLHESKWDIIVSNPPYISAEEKPTITKRVLHYEPEQALFAESKNPLIFYVKIAEYAQKALSKKGILAMELNQYYPQKIAEIVEQRGFAVELEKDMAGNWRFLWARFKA